MSIKSNVIKAGLGSANIGGGGGNSLIVAGSTLSAYEFDAENLNQDSGGAGAAVTNGDPVGYATDLSGEGYFLLQGTTAAKPLYSDTEFSTGALSKPATGDYLYHNTSLLSSPGLGSWANVNFSNDWSMVVGFKTPSTFSTNMSPCLIQASSEPAGAAKTVITTDGRWGIQVHWDTPSGSAAFHNAFTAGTMAVSTEYVVSLTFTASDNTFRCYLNGVLGSPYVLAAGRDMATGARFFGTGTPGFNSNILRNGAFVSGLGFYSKALSDEERGSVEGRLADRMGITL